MLKVGLEKEAFVVDNQSTPQLVPSGIPHDDCGWLVEGRSVPSTDVAQAVFSLKAEMFKIDKEIRAKNLALVDEPVMKIPKKLRIAAGRTFAKGLVKYQNFYGFDDHPLKGDESSAGVHLSFTFPRTTFVMENGHRLEVNYNANFDWPWLFMALDHEFEEEIKASRRKPGFYEVKPDGRVEYRSLPANVNLDKVISVTENLLKELRPTLY